MKIDRLIGITFYLLNRDVVTTQELATRFEVSGRTISRDIDTLSLAGIPVTSATGASGGYSILDTFKLEKNITTADDYQNILISLKSMCSAYFNKKIESTLEKMLTSADDTNMQKVFVDFSICREGANTSEYLKELENAITNKNLVKFDYSNVNGELSNRCVEPLALSYKWYDWYLLAFCQNRNDHRIFKLIRIDNLKVTNDKFKTIHPNVSELLEKQWSTDIRTKYHVKLRCQSNVRAAVSEYIRGTITEELENGDFILSFTVPENERVWFALLLSFGDSVEVLEPESLKKRLLNKSQEIFLLYKKP